MTYIYSHRLDWGAASVNFSWGHNAAVCGHSNQVMKYMDINMSYGFGPEDEGPNFRALLMVLGAGVVHKDRQDITNQICV